MVSIASDVMNALRRAHAERAGDVDLGLFLSRFPDLGDDELADLIELDARERLRAGLHVDLPRYLAAIPDLASRRIALDAAIEFALRSLSGSRHTKIEAVEALCEAYPELVPAISAAWFLNDALGSTTGASALVQPPAELRLPMGIGPLLSAGKHRYELRERVGVGSHGAVYLAVDHALTENDKPAWVAVKVTSVLPNEHALSHRVREEATKARRVTHPNIARVLDRGTMEGGGREFVVYEHVDAGDLQDACDRGRLPRDQRALARLVAKVARAVQAAHSAGLVHSDLKPSNILLTSTGEPKVADFGLAARRFDLSDTGARVQLGTLGFIAPERYRAEPGSEGVLSDVYSLGGILYYLLTGRAPNGSTPDEVAERLGTDLEDLPRDFGNVEPDLAAICRRALAMRPQDRYPSADALANDLDAWLEFRVLPWRRPGPARTAKLFCRRNPVVCAAGVLLLLTGVGATAAIIRVRTSEHNRRLELALESAQDIANAQTEAEQEVLSAIRMMISVLKDRDGSIKSEWLPSLTILESVSAPIVLKSSNRQNVRQLWSSRIEIARDLVAAESARGRETDSDTMLWRIALGFWLLRAEEFADAREVLMLAARDWTDRLGPGDTWSVYAATLSDCAAIGEIEKRAAGAGLTDDDRARLRETVARLESSLAFFRGRHQGNNVHVEALIALARSMTKGLLDDPVRQQEFRQRLARLQATQ